MRVLVVFGDLLDRHRKTRKTNRRMALQVKNLDIKSETEIHAIREASQIHRQRGNSR